MNRSSNIRALNQFIRIRLLIGLFFVLKQEKRKFLFQTGGKSGSSMLRNSPCDGVALVAEQLALKCVSAIGAQSK
jgi:hypothetical protein